MGKSRKLMAVILAFLMVLGISVPSIFATETVQAASTPARPGTITVKSIKTSPGKVVIQYTSAPSATAYQVQFAKNINFTSSPVTYTFTGTTATITNLAGGKSYYVHVRPINKKSYGTAYGSWTGTRITTVPATSLTGAKISSVVMSGSAVRVSFAKVSNASEYNIQLSEDKSFSRLLASKTVTGTTCTLGNIQEGKTVYVRMRAAERSPAYSIYSNWTSPVAIKRPYAPPIPPAFSDISSSGSYITVTSSMPKNTDALEVYYSTSSSFSPLVNVLVTSSRTFKQKETPGYLYYVKMRARRIAEGRALNSSWSKSKSVVVLPAGMNINSLSSPAVGKAYISYSTKETSGRNGYQIQYADNSGFSSARTTTSQSTSINLTGLSQGTTYYFRVRQYVIINGSYYYGPWSTSKTIKIKKQASSSSSAEKNSVTDITASAYTQVIDITADAYKGGTSSGGSNNINIGGGSSSGGGSSHIDLGGSSSGGSSSSGVSSSLSNVPNGSRLTISSLGISVLLYNASTSSESYNQAVVDRSNSALYANAGILGAGPWIADHNNQGFSGLYNAKSGTVAYITKPNGTRIKLTCVSRFSGHNTGTNLTDANYNNVSDRYPNYVGMYTCNGANWHNVTITLWK